MGEWRDIVHVQLDERTLVKRRPEVESERYIAVSNLIDGNRFRLINGDPGPYALHLRQENSCIVFDLRTQKGTPLTKIRLPLTSFSGVAMDYLITCTAYYRTIRNVTPSYFEAIDMGRRGLHNEGASLLGVLLRSEIEMDHATARCLFTLLCVLQIQA